MGKIYRIELCIKYDTCKRCPNNKECEAEYKKYIEKHNSNKAKGDSQNSNIKNLGD